MGYFDKISEAAFKEADDGVVIYYPNGAMGKGRVVPDLATKDKLYKFHKRLFKALLFVALPYAWLVGMSGVFTVVSFSPIILMAALMSLRQYWLIHKLPKHQLKLGMSEAMGKGAQALPNWYYWVLGVTSVVTMLFGLFTPYLINKTYHEAITLVIGFSCFGLLGLFLSIKIYKLKTSSIK